MVRTCMYWCCCCLEMMGTAVIVNLDGAGWTEFVCIQPLMIFAVLILLC